MISAPRISIIMPSHNRPVLLKEAINSLMEQTMAHWEAVIVDDASSPPVTVPEDNRLIIVNHSVSQGGAKSKNTGIAHAHAPVLAFLDDDDLYDSSYLESALGLLENNPDIEVVFMGVSWFGARGVKGQQAYDSAMARVLSNLESFTLDKDQLRLERVSLFTSLLDSVPMAFQRPVVRKSTLERIGLYQPDILLWDCDWALRAALEANCALITKGLYLQRAEGQGYSSKSSRYLEHLKSNALMKERLLLGSKSSITKRAIANSAAEAYFNIAWQHYKNSDRSEAAKSLLKSIRVNPTLRGFKMLLRLMQPIRS